MNKALVGTACGQLLTLFEFAFGYPQSKEFKDRAKQLKEFETDNELPDEGDSISKAHDQQEAEEQFSTASLEPKPKKQKFSKGRSYH